MVLKSVSEGKVYQMCRDLSDYFGNGALHEQATSCKSMYNSGAVRKLISNVYMKMLRKKIKFQMLQTCIFVGFLLVCVFVIVVVVAVKMVLVVVVMIVLVVVVDGGGSGCDGVGGCVLFSFISYVFKSSLF